MEASRPRSSGFAAPRRIFTAPVAPSPPQPASPAQSTGGLVDTLYDHPNVKIVSFTAGNSLLIGHRSPAVQDVEPGSLRWTSQLERTIAVGPFRIYRAPGSVAFLSCGSALQPILPKSQVWCVDEESSKFVLQIRRPQYWRIELPIEDEGEIRLTQQLREVFDSILQFEKTECPFQRSFTVELPELPDTPVKKRPWTPARRSSASLPLTPTTPVEIARLHEGTPRGPLSLGDLRSRLEARRASMNDHTSRPGPYAEREENKGLGTEHDDGSFDLKPVFDRPRSISAVSPHRASNGNPLPKIKEMRSARSPAKSPALLSPTESSESVNRREPWLPIPLPPSPPLSIPGSPRHSSPRLAVQNAPEAVGPHHTVGSKPSQTWSVTTTDSLPNSNCSTTTAPSSEAPGTPMKTAPSTPLPASPSESPSSSSSSGGARPSIRRATTSSSISSSSRVLSPLTSAANLLTGPHRTSPPPVFNPTAATTTATATTSAAVSRPSASRPAPKAKQLRPSASQAALAAVRRLPMTVLHKTCEILMSPPSHLINLMLNVAARIAAGEWRGLVFGTGEGGERVSVTWDWSDDDDPYQQRAHGRGYGFGGLGRDGRIWLRGRKSMGQLRMAGAFPESDDDDTDTDDDDLYDSPGQDGGDAEDVDPLGEALVQALRRESKTTPNVQQQQPGTAEGEPQKSNGAEWGVD
ncbi:inheritance of peroxisomes protein 1-domain-containing protein [Dichotomopilus funicola]|uniref:Inheritance of peroxisomes protein 1 n=1 Tax=Dichotomopilus funicola TaxID=1934379 RepID=A0AAN6V858_9PEZI|nr:inheritance of peroxisomes protein 1-domain-containing protein [Dichotomopilus funicola]